MKKLLTHYQAYRSWARRPRENSILFFAVIGMVSAATISLLKITGLLSIVLPWLVVGLGLIAALDSLGAAHERGHTREGLIRFVLILGLFSGIARGLLILKR